MDETKRQMLFSLLRFFIAHFGEVFVGKGIVRQFFAAPAIHQKDGEINKRESQNTKTNPPIASCVVYIAFVIQSVEQCGKHSPEKDVER